MNQVNMIGYLTKNVEFKYLPSGTAVAKFTLAHTQRYKKKDGSYDESTCFIDISYFGHLAEIANMYLKKGSQVGIVGSLRQEMWNEKETGRLCQKHSIVGQTLHLVNTKNSKNINSNNANTASVSPENAIKAPISTEPLGDSGNDEIPF